MLVFLALSFELARWLTLENVERTDILDLLTAEARGDAASMLAQLHACTPSCREHVRTDARLLKRPGSVLILADSSATAYTLTGAVGFHADRLEGHGPPAGRAVRDGVADRQRAHRGRR